MEEVLQGLQAVDDTLRERYERLSQMYEDICRSKYTCLEYINKSEDEVTKFKRERDPTARLNLRAGIIQGYTHTILTCREKRDMILVCQALEELGDFHYACQDKEAASRAWNDGVDAVFGALNTCCIWRDLMQQYPNPTESFGFWSCLIGISLLGKLARFTTSSALHRRLEYIKFASALAQSIFSCSVSHPDRISDLALYQARELWPCVDTFENPQRIQPQGLREALNYISTSLLDNDCAIEALPVLVMYEYVARYRFRSATLTLEARRLRFDACIKLGLIEEAADIWSKILSLHDLPHTDVLNPSCIPSSDPPRSSKLFKNNSALDEETNASFVQKLCNPDEYQPSDDAILTSDFKIALRLSRMKALLFLGGFQSPPSLESPETVNLCHLAVEKMSTQLQEEMLPEAEDKFTGMTRMALAECFLFRCQITFDNRNFSDTRMFAQSAMSILSMPCTDPLAVDRSNILWLQCRLHLVNSALRSDQFEMTAREIERGQAEAEAIGERLLKRRLSIRKVELYLKQGDLTRAEDLCRNIVALTLELDAKDEDYCFTLRLLSHLQRIRCVSSNDIHPLSESKLLLTEALHVVNQLLIRTGWVGPSASVVVSNLYLPLTRPFIQLNLEVAQVLHDSLQSGALQLIKVRYICPKLVS